MRSAQFALQAYANGLICLCSCIAQNAMMFHDVTFLLRWCTPTPLVRGWPDKIPQSKVRLMKLWTKIAPSCRFARKQNCSLAVMTALYENGVRHLYIGFPLGRYSHANYVAEILKHALVFQALLRWALSMKSMLLHGMCMFIQKHPLLQHKVNKLTVIECLPGA